jgi:hypothetical protein
VKKSRSAQPGDPSQIRIPNYGRGAAFGLASALIIGVAWAILTELSGELNFMAALAVGWLVGEAVKRGMGNVDRTGVWITIYGTLAAISVAMYIYIALRIRDHGGVVTIGEVVRTFFVALSDLTFLAIFVIFTVGGCWLGVAICKEGMPDRLLKRKSKKGQDD